MATWTSPRALPSRGAQDLRASGRRTALFALNRRRPLPTTCVFGFGKAKAAKNERRVRSSARITRPNVRAEEEAAPWAVRLPPAEDPNAVRIRPVVEPRGTPGDSLGRTLEDAAGNVVQEAALPLHPVVKVLAERAMSGSAPGKRTDPYKIGLVIQGGGMRGVISAGGLTVLHFLGLTRCFDAAYGSSAGAMNLTYFLAGQPEGARAYIEDLATKDFINLFRLLPMRRKENVRPALDLSILLDDVMGTLKPLAWDAVLHSPTKLKDYTWWHPPQEAHFKELSPKWFNVPLEVVSSNLGTMDSVVLQEFEDVEDLKKCLRASATVPAIAGPMVEHRGMRLVDAAVFEGIPLPSAIDDGCTHVLALLTQSRPPPEEPEERLTRKKRIQRYFANFAERLVKNTLLNPPYMERAWEIVQERDNAGVGDYLTLDHCEHGSTPPYERVPSSATNPIGCHVLAVYPDRSDLLGGKDVVPLSIDHEALEMGLEAGIRACAKVLAPVTQQKLAIDTARTEGALLAPWVGRTLSRLTGETSEEKEGLSV